jgi:hypothetical protein
MRTGSYILTNKEGGSKIMRTIKIIGYAGIASVAAVLSLSSFVVTETAQARVVPESNAGTLVHRVSYNLAADTQYKSDSIGYKWGQKDHVTESDANWSGSTKPQGGYKWGKSVERSVDGSNYEEARNPWARSSFSEQARNPWARSSFSEQARNPWARSSFSEQARNPWARSSFSEQARNPWARSSFSEQARNPWARS